MKKILVLLFSLFISFNTYGEWTKITESETSGNIFYTEIESINKQDGYVYYWILQDNLKPDDYGDMSSLALYEGDCIKKRFKYLSLTFYTKPMGSGNPTTENVSNEWEYAPPGTVGAGTLDFVCNYVK